MIESFNSLDIIDQSDFTSLVGKYSPINRIENFFNRTNRIISNRIFSNSFQFFLLIAKKRTISSKSNTENFFDKRYRVTQIKMCWFKWLLLWKYAFPSSLLQGGQDHFSRKKCLYLFQFWSNTKIHEYEKVWELYNLFNLIKMFWNFLKISHAFKK